MRLNLVSAFDDLLRHVVHDAISFLAVHLVELRDVGPVADIAGSPFVPA